MVSAAKPEPQPVDPETFQPTEQEVAGDNKPEESEEERRGGEGEEEAVVQQTAEDDLNEEEEDDVTKVRLQPVIEEQLEAEPPIQDNEALNTTSNEAEQPPQQPQSVAEEVKPRVTQERAIDVAGVPEVVVVAKEKLESEDKAEDKKDTSSVSGDTTPKPKHKKKSFLSFFKRKSKQHKNSESEDGEVSPTPAGENSQTTPTAEFAAVVTPPSQDRSPPKTAESSPVPPKRKESTSTENTPLLNAEQTASAVEVEEEQRKPPQEDDEDTLPELGQSSREEPSKPQSPDVVSLAESEVEPCTMTPPVTLTAAQPTPFTRAGQLMQQANEPETKQPEVEQPADLVTEVVPRTQEDPDVVSPKHVDNHFVVVAIDFGTTFR